MFDGGNFDAVLARLKEATGLTSDSNIAKLLGISPQALNNRKRAGSLPATEIVDICNQLNIDLNYIFRGERRMEDGTLRAVITEIQNWQFRERRLVPPDRFWEVVYTLADIAEGESSRVKPSVDRVLRLVA